MILTKMSSANGTKMAPKTKIIRAHFSKLGKKGGKAKAASMTKKERSEHARQMALTRFGKKSSVVKP